MGGGCRGVETVVSSPVAGEVDVEERAQCGFAIGFDDVGEQSEPAVEHLSEHGDATVGESLRTHAEHFPDGAFERSEVELIGEEGIFAAEALVVTVSAVEIGVEKSGVAE